jgi:serine/threonine protein phosphatase 1
MGDMIDRGPKSAEMLVWCIEEAPENFHFLLGNHEDMAGCAIGRSPGRIVLYDEWGPDPWCYNGGIETTRQLIQVTDLEWRRDVLVPWLRALSPYVVVEVGERPIMLVHAGFRPGGWDEATQYDFCDFNNDPLSHKEVVDVGYGFGQQSEQHMVWARSGWYDVPEPAPIETVYGHTPKSYLVRSAFNERTFFEANPDLYPGDLAGAWFQTVGEDLGSCWHYLNRHNIDCGCAYGGRLCCLRLEDFEEFYVDGPST